MNFMHYKINSKEDYIEIMNTLYNFMQKGESNLTDNELEELKDLAEAAEKYEDETLDLQPGLSQISLRKI